MMTVLCAGKLTRDPQRRTSAAGKAFATALLSVATDDGPALVSAIAFGEAAERLLAHTQGDSLSLLGKAKLSSWEKAGETKHGLSLTVDRLLSPFELSKRRAALTEDGAHA